MDFRKGRSKTSEKLAWLAGLIEGKLSKEFSQTSIEHCVIGLGYRVQSNGKLGGYGSGSNVCAFIKRYGVTEDEAHFLFNGCYSKIDGRMSDFNYRTSTPAHPARVLRLLARRYAGRGE